MTDIPNEAAFPHFKTQIYNQNNALLEAASTNITGESITSGNVGVNRITNALGSAGSYIGGNIPIASITNAAKTVGASIGGNIPEIALTNAAASLGDDLGGNIPAVAITNALAGNTAPIGGSLITVSQGFVETPVALSVTNGQAITVAYGKYILSGVGQDSGSTNEVTLVAPTVAGRIVKFIGSFTATNAVTFPSSGATRIPVNAVLEDVDNDTITFEAFDTSTWTCTSFINNQ